MINTQVGYMPLGSALDVRPQIIEGKRDTVWVRTLSADSNEIIEAAVKKIRECYGISIEDVTVYDGCQFSS
jgi:hypothetical protein